MSLSLFLTGQAGLAYRLYKGQAKEGSFGKMEERIKETPVLRNNENCDNNTPAKRHISSVAS